MKAVMCTAGVPSLGPAYILFLSLSADMAAPNACPPLGNTLAQEHLSRMRYWETLYVNMQTLQRLTYTLRALNTSNTPDPF